MATNTAATTGAGSLAAVLTVQVWTDVICPFCPIGERRFSEALRQFANRDRVEMVHRSYRLGPDQPTQGVEGYLAGKYGARQPPAAILLQVAQMAAQAGLTYRLEGTRVGDTLDAHRLLHWAAAEGRYQALADRLSQGYFAEHADVFDHATLLRLAGEAGLDRAAAAAVLNSDRFAAEVAADQHQAQSRGVASVPHFLIGEHLSISGGQSPATFLAALERAWTA